MLQKIKRDICIIKYRKLPLIAYDKKENDEVCFFPQHQSCHWIKYDKALNRSNNRNLKAEFIQLLQNLNIEDLIFFGATNQPWISKFTSKRTDHKTLVKSLSYFKSHKIWRKFNGGVAVNINDMSQFFTHFYTLTKCDGSFFDYYFIDQNEYFLFYLHYSGEIEVRIQTKKSAKQFHEQVKKMRFIIRSKN